MPGYLNQMGIEAKTIDPKTWDQQPGIAALKKRFGVGEQLIQTVPGKGWNTILRLYGPLESFYDKSWKPGDPELPE